MKKLFYSLLIIVTGFSFYSCEKDKGLSLTQKVNNWIQEDMSSYYRWEDKMPAINPANESDPKKYFEKLLYRTEDKWSIITDDAQSLLNSLEGIETTFGYSLTFGRFSGTKNVFAVVEYVYPNTPASRADIKRGDIILGIDGTYLTEDNFTNVIYKSSGKLIMGVYDPIENVIAPSSEISLTAEVLNLNPVVIKKVIETNGKKIGYLFYAQYLHNYDSDLDAAFQQFKSDGVKDIVLDLRYNPGGAVLSAIHLCSILAPKTIVNNGSTLITMQWNNTLQTHWQANDPRNLRYTFDNTVPLNMDLNKIYILTGNGSASASELTITGLDPYMEVVLIGERTYGKYAASAPLQKEIKKNGEWVVDPELKNWVMMPIIYTYANSEGVTDFKDGFAPTFVIEEDIIRNPVPLGDVSEPLLAKAITEITGITPAPSPQNVKAMRKNLPNYTIIDRRFSRFDKFKNALIDDQIKTRFE